MKGIYLDNAATTKIDKSVLKEVIKFSEEIYANPSSKHELGSASRREIEIARKKIADFIGSNSEEIIFTSGGTESNNFAIKGLALANPDKKHIITSLIEHPSILECFKFLEKRGYNIDYIGVDSEGIVDPKDILKKIKKDTLLVSIMHVNNEIGTIQPISEIGKICRENNIYFHTDAIQSFKKIDINVNSMNIDLMSVSGHKFHAPKGIGFLYVRLGIKVNPLIDGGGQEFTLRGGTENITGIVGMAKALDIDLEEEKVRSVRDFMMDELMNINKAKLNGSREKRIYNNINISFYGIEGEALMLLLNQENIYVSTGSACASSKVDDSHVLKAINSGEFYINSNIRITPNNLIDIETAKIIIQHIRDKVKKLRNLSPYTIEDDIEHNISQNRLGDKNE